VAGNGGEPSKNVTSVIAITERLICLLIINSRATLRAGMTASRLNHRERVIPAQTDHLQDYGGVIGLIIQGCPVGFIMTTL